MAEDAPKDGIRTGVIADAPGIARVHVDAWRTAYTKQLPSTVFEDLRYEDRERMWHDYIAARDIRRVFVATNAAHEIVGFAACGPNRTGDPRYPGELYAIYLLAAERGGGRGRALFAAVGDYLQSQGLTPFQLWVISGDATADQFYEKLGGRIVASQPTVVDGVDAYEHAYGFGSRA